MLTPMLEPHAQGPYTIKVRAPAFLVVLGGASWENRREMKTVVLIFWQDATELLLKVFYGDQK